jgi:hypothetical protein
MRSITKTCIAAHYGFKPVSSKKWDRIAKDFPSLPVFTAKSQNVSKIGVRSSLYALVVARKTRAKALSGSRCFHVDTASDIEKSLEL